MLASRREAILWITTDSVTDGEGGQIRQHGLIRSVILLYYCGDARPTILGRILLDDRAVLHRML